MALRPKRRSLGAPPTAHPGAAAWSGTRFENRRQPGELTHGRLAMVRDLATKGRSGRPPRPVPRVTPDLTSPAAELSAHWLGHATVLVELGGRRILTDPVWSLRVSPSQKIGPKRLHPMAVELAELPPIDVVAISHDHYDHLDDEAVTWLATHQACTFAVPLGVAAHLRSWGIAPERIVECDWDDEVEVAGLALRCCEAQHFSGRWLERNPTLWCSWSIADGERRVYFGGDTGWFPGLAELGAALGPHALTLLPIGAYGPRWGHIHVNPEEALQMHRDLRGEVFLPIHWAGFDLALHPWAEPIDRLVEAAGDLTVVTPRLGERVLPELPADRWWRS